MEMLDIKYQKDIILYIDSKNLNNIIKCVDKAYPNESCGLIFGKILSEYHNGEFQYKYYCEKFDCIESDQKSPVAFLIEDLEKLDMILRKAIIEDNLRLISIFHSHPSGSIPSGFDINYMEILNKSGLKQFKNQIWTIMDSINKKINGFIYLEKEIMQIEIILVE
jgi:proteasome lid subunit RPN8/RPN11